MMLSLRAIPIVFIMAATPSLAFADACSEVFGGQAMVLTSVDVGAKSKHWWSGLATIGKAIVSVPSAFMKSPLLTKAPSPFTERYKGARRAAILAEYIGSGAKNAPIEELQGVLVRHLAYFATLRVVGKNQSTILDFEVKTSDVNSFLARAFDGATESFMKDLVSAYVDTARNREFAVSSYPGFADVERRLPLDYLIEAAARANSLTLELKNLLLSGVTQEDLMFLARRNRYFQPNKGSFDTVLTASSAGFRTQLGFLAVEKNAREETRNILGRDYSDPSAGDALKELTAGYGSLGFHRWFHVSLDGWVGVDYFSGKLVTSEMHAQSKENSDLNKIMPRFIENNPHAFYLFHSLRMILMGTHLQRVGQYDLSWAVAEGTARTEETLKWLAENPKALDAPFFAAVTYLMGLIRAKDPDKRTNAERVIDYDPELANVPQKILEWHGNPTALIGQEQAATVPNASVREYFENFHRELLPLLDIRTPEDAQRFFTGRSALLLGDR